MNDFNLQPNANFSGLKGPLLLVILDGVGLYKGREDGYPANAVDLARTVNGAVTMLAELAGKKDLQILMDLLARNLGVE